MQPSVVTLRSAHGCYLTASPEGVVEAKALEPGPWEYFSVVPVDETHAALQSCHGFYLTAARDDERQVPQCKATEIGPWEVWTVLGHHDLTTDTPIVYWQGEHGGFLTAGTEGEVEARATELGPWEQWTSDPPDWWLEPEPIVTNPNLLRGDLTRYERVILDGSGPRIIMGCHFMEGFSAYCHGKSVGGLDVAAQLDIIAEHYGLVRNLDVLGFWDMNRPGDADEWEAWKGREVTPIAFISNGERTIPPTPDYWVRKEEYVTMLHERGLRIFDDRGDMNSWTRDQKLEHMRQNGQFYNRLPFGKEVLAGIFAINEAWQNGGDDRDLLIDMIEAFREGAGWLPAIVGLSAPGGDSDPDALAACNPPMTSWEPEMPDSYLYWSKDPATVLTNHGNRGDPTHIIEHYWGYGYDETMRDSGKVSCNTEPVGGGDGVSVGQVNDPELLCGLTAGALIGGQPWIFMSGNGVFWNGPIQDMPGFAEVARLPTFLPTDIASWATVCHAGTRFQGTRILAAVDPTRADHAIADDGRFAIIVHTQEQAGNALPCERDCAEFTVINLLTGMVERSGPLHVGEYFQHGGVARLVVGVLAGYPGGPMPPPPPSGVPMAAPMAASTKPRAGRLERLRRIVGERGWTA